MTNQTLDMIQRPVQITMCLELLLSWWYRIVIYSTSCLWCSSWVTVVWDEVRHLWVRLRERWASCILPLYHLTRGFILYNNGFLPLLWRRTRHAMCIIYEYQEGKSRSPQRGSTLHVVYCSIRAILLSIAGCLACERHLARLGRDMKLCQQS